MTPRPALAPATAAAPVWTDGAAEVGRAADGDETGAEVEGAAGGAPETETTLEVRVLVFVFVSVLVVSEETGAEATGGLLTTTGVVAGVVAGTAGGGVPVGA